MKICRKYFTLIELLVAMGLLALLVMLMLQLFSGAQRLWVASEKRSNVYADARVAMELMAELLDGIQFSYGETLNASDEYEPAPTQNSLFSLDSSATDSTDGMNSNSLIFLTKTSRDLPKTDNDCRFISFRRGASNDDKLRGKLLMVIYSDKNNADNFYALFPPYASSNRGAKLGELKGYFNTLVANFKTHTGNGEYEYCQVIAENVVSFKISAYVLSGTSTPTDTRTLSKASDSADLDTPPYMLTLQMTVLDADNYEKWRNIGNAAAKTNFLIQHQRTFCRNVFIGNRWALDSE